MKKLSKKVFLGLGVSASIIAPVVAVISCGSNSPIHKVAQRTDVEKQQDHIKELNDQNISKANEIIEKVAKLELQPTTAIKVDAANLKATDLTFPAIPTELSQWGVHLEVVTDSIHVSSENVTTANMKVIVKSTLDGTKTVEYNASVNNLLTAAQYQSSEADKAREDAKITAQKLIDDAVAKAQAPILTNDENLKLTASLVKPEMFAPIQIDTTSAVVARVTSIEQSLTTIDGTEVVANVQVSSTVAGTIAKEYKVSIKGFLTNDAYEALHGVKLTLQTYRQMTLADLPKDGLVWERGITYYAYAQAISYLRNFVEKLGWSSPDHDVVVPEVSSTGPIVVDGYVAGKTVPTAMETSLITEREKSAAYRLTGLPAFKSVADQSGWKLAGGTWTKFKHIEIATDSVVRGAGLFKEVNFPTGFATKAPLDKYKDMLVALKTAYSSGPNMQGADTILFSLDETNNKFKFWVAGSAAAAQKNHDDLLKLKTTFESAHVKAGVDTTTQKPLASTNGLLVDPGGIDHTPNESAVGILKDFNWNEAYGAYKGDGNFEKIQFEKFGSWIDGDHPGQLKLRLWTANGESHHSQSLGTFTHTFVSQPNAYPVFETLTGASKDKYMLMLWNMIDNMKKHFNISQISMATGYINPDFTSLLHYLIATPLSEAKFREIFDQLNNGSHYFPAIEVFARGIVGLDGNIRPTDGGASSMIGGNDRISKTGAAVGMATTLTGKDIINYIYKEDSIHYDSITQKNI